MFSRCLPLLLGVIIAYPAGAETPPAAPDFSQGFARLITLGLPPLDATARWSTLGDANANDYRLTQLFKSLKGNGWKLADREGKPPQTLPAAALQIDETPAEPATQPPRRGLLQRMLGGGSSAKPARLPEADLTKDVRALIAALAKSAENNPFRYEQSLAGKVLVFATQIYQNGQPALANDLTLALFELCESREVVVDAAVSLIADHAYQLAATQFFTSGDWAAYHRELTTLVARFPRGWASREAVAMLLPQLAKQAAGQSAPVPTLAGVDLTPKTLAAAAQLAAAPPAVDPAALEKQLEEATGRDFAAIPPRMRAQIMASMHSRGLQQFSSGTSWLLAPPPDAAFPPAVDQLVKLGLQALPILAALAEDPFLTYFPNGNGYSSSMYSSYNDDDAERIQNIFNSLHRPSSRGEIACLMLKSALPDPANDLRQADPETLRELALTFWKANQHASRDELAMIFLRDSADSQIQQAAEILATSTDAKAHQALEDFVLASDSALEQFRIVRSYLTSRKAAAKPFYQTYAKLVRSQLADTTSNDDPRTQAQYEIKQAGGAEKTLKMLERLVDGTSPRAIAIEIARESTKPADAEVAIRGLLESMKGQTPVKCLYALLEGAVAATEPRIRATFLQNIGNIEWQDESRPSRTPTTDRTLPEAELKVWRQLMADTRPASDPPSPYTVGGLAAAMLELSVNAETYYAVEAAAPILRQSSDELYRVRSTARLAGQPLPPLPDESRVTPERLEAIVAAAKAKPAPEVHPYLTTLSPDERAAWLTWLNNHGDILVPKSVRDLRFTVVELAKEDPGAPVDRKLAALVEPGFTVTPASLESLIKSLAAHAADYSRSEIELNPTEFGPGLARSTTLYPMPEPTSDEDPDAGPDSWRDQRLLMFFREIASQNDLGSVEAVMAMDVRDRDNQRSVTWLVEHGKATPVKPDDLAELNAGIQALIDAPEIKPLFIRLIILAKPDIDRFKDSQKTDPEDPFPDN